MGPVFVAFGWLLLIGTVFLPTFVIAIVMLRSVARAFALSAAFTMGATAGVLAAMLFAGAVVNRAQPEWLSGTLFIVYVAAAAIAGGVLAVFGLSKLSKYPPWRRF